MKLVVSNDGQVEYLTIAGSKVVKGRTLESNVQRMIEQATTKEITDTYKGFPLCVNGKFYFPEIPEPVAAPAQNAAKPKRKR